MDKNFKEFCIEHQYELPRKLYVYAKRYPNVSFLQALKLYELAVAETLIIFKAKTLFDSPLYYGRGLACARDIWIEKMSRAETIVRKNLEEENNNAEECF